MALAYVDFSSQEMGIAAALSGDAALLEAYRSGDVYLSFAKQAGLAPPDATKASHGEVRDRCKAVVLGTLYGMGPETLAAPHRPAALRGPGAAAAAPGDLPAVLALVGGGGGELRADPADRDRVRLALARRAGLEPALA